MSHLEALRIQLAAAEGEAEAAAAGAASLQQEAREGERRFGDLHRQLVEAQQRLVRANAAAEQQAVRADKWESQCVGAHTNNDKSLLLASCPLLREPRCGQE